MNRALRSILKFIFAFILFGMCSYTQAQGGLAESAKQYYQAKDFIQALDMYQQLNAKFPTSSTYNFRYGVCLYETRFDINSAIVHLSESAKKGINDSYLYLGQCYATQYQYQKSIDSYNTYIKKARPRADELTAVNTFLEQSEDGLRWLNKIEKIQVYDTTTVPLEDFYTHYTLSPEVGHFTTTIPAELGKTSGPAFVNEKGNRMVYTSNKGSNLDLAQVCKFVDHWEQENRIDTTINSNSDECYPFILADGATLYFCSKGHHSMGGYDLFTTRFNPQTNTYFPPLNLGFPFNSPDDDLLFTLDEYNNVGQFASTRGCKQGQIRIYSFIPSKIKSYITSTDPNYLAKAAQLLPDSSYWVPKPLLQSDNLVSYDFRFDIKDDVVYHHESDFKSSEALQLFRKYQHEHQALDWTIVELEKERKKVFDKEKYDSDKILRMEQQIPQKRALINQLAEQCRLAEISKL